MHSCCYDACCESHYAFQHQEPAHTTYVLNILSGALQSSKRLPIVQQTTVRCIVPLVLARCVSRLAPRTLQCNMPRIVPFFGSCTDTLHELHYVYLESLVRKLHMLIFLFVSACFLFLLLTSICLCHTSYLAFLASLRELATSEQTTFLCATCRESTKLTSDL